MGIDTIAASIGEERITLEDAHEPYLIQSGLLYRTQKGRMVSQLGYTHMGIPYPFDEDRSGMDGEEGADEDAPETAEEQMRLI